MTAWMVSPAASASDRRFSTTMPAPAPGRVPAADASNGAAHVESDCNCLERTPVPAIAAKKDDKRTAVEKQITDAIELTPVFAIEFKVADASGIPFEPPVSNYHHALLSSLPSRAPPRL